MTEQGMGVQSVYVSEWLVHQQKQMNCCVKVPEIKIVDCPVKIPGKIASAVELKRMEKPKNRSFSSSPQWSRPSQNSYINEENHFLKCGWLYPKITEFWGDYFEYLLSGKKMWSWLMLKSLPVFIIPALLFSLSDHFKKILLPLKHCRKRLQQLLQ